MFAKVCIGTRAFVAERGAGAGPTAAQEARARLREEEGQTVLFVYLRALPGPEPEGGRSAGGGFLAGAVAVADVLRPETRGTVAALGRMGIEVWMASGDNRRTAHAVARRVGIANVLAEVKPGDKAEQVRRLRHAGGSAGGPAGDAGAAGAAGTAGLLEGRPKRLVAMVGDGVNDSPAIAEVRYPPKA